jgi:hypothetical protein
MYTKNPKIPWGLTTPLIMAIICHHLARYHLTICGDVPLGKKLITLNKRIGVAFASWGILI